MPVRGILGSDYLKVRPEFKVMRNPYGDDDLVVVPAITPDVAVFHAYRADLDGNVLADRRQDNWLLAQAAGRVIVTVEEIVDSGDLVRGTFDTVIGAIHVDAIVLAPHGAHPTACRDYYRDDAKHIREYVECAKSDERFKEYLDRFVRVPEHRYQALVGRDR